MWRAVLVAAVCWAGPALAQPSYPNGYTISSNRTDNALNAASITDRAGAFSHIVHCNVIQTYRMGMQKSSATAFWSTKCARGESYVVSILPDENGSTKIVDCETFSAVTKLECFRPLEP